jgi:hypothetical protein
MDMLKIVEAAKANTGAKSNRDLSLKMGWAPNYVFSLLEGTRPSEEALATLLKAAGQDWNVPPLQPDLFKLAEVVLRDTAVAQRGRQLIKALQCFLRRCRFGQIQHDPHP